MLGLKETADISDDRFVKFFSEIQNAAASIGCVFFAWSGEGHEFSNENMDGEDMSGWLIPTEDVSVFEPQWRKGDDSIEPRFSDNIKFAVWKKSIDGIEISFVDERLG